MATFEPKVSTSFKILSAHGIKSLQEAAHIPSAIRSSGHQAISRYWTARSQMLSPSIGSLPAVWPSGLRYLLLLLAIWNGMELFVLSVTRNLLCGSSNRKRLKR